MGMPENPFWRELVKVPVAAYSVSGEYAMLKMAVDQGIMQSDIIMESITAIKRAGADMVIKHISHCIP